jgi:hypothetical protein
LSQKLCGAKHGNRITFQFTLWDILKEEFDESGKKAVLRRINNVARLYSHLIVSQALSLTILRILDLSRLSKQQVAFLKEFLPSLRKACSDPSISGLTAERTAKPDVVSGVERFQKGSQGSALKDILKLADDMDRVLEKYAREV